MGILCVFLHIEFAYLYGLFAAFILAPLVIIEIVVKCRGGGNHV